MADEGKAVAFPQCFDILRVAGDLVIDADDFVAFRQESFAQVGAQKPRPAGDDRPHAEGFSFLMLIDQWRL